MLLRILNKEARSTCTYLNIMKILIIALSVLTVVSSQRALSPGNDIEYSPRPYSFNYLAEGDEGSSGHQEEGDGAGNVRGSYTVTDIDGRSRIVEYVAGPEGFRAFVRTNEPGTDNQNPADVVVESSAADARSRAAVRTSADVGAQRVNAPRVVTTGPQRQGVRYVLVPNNDPRARGYQ